MRDASIKNVIEVIVNKWSFSVWHVFSLNYISRCVYLFHFGSVKLNWFGEDEEAFEGGADRGAGLEDELVFILIFGEIFHFAGADDFSGGDLVVNQATVLAHYNSIAGCELT